MKEIELTQGKIALVDDEDFEYINQWKWHAVKKKYGIYYASRITRLSSGKQRGLAMHTAIIGVCEGYECDHIDGDGLNNQRTNLRFVTHRQNLQNRHEIKSSRFVGVGWHKLTQKWRAQIRIDGKKKDLGYFNNETEAFDAYKQAIELIGETLI